MTEAAVSFAATSPPPYAATPATHTDPSSPWGSASDETDITTERPRGQRLGDEHRHDRGVRQLLPQAGIVAMVGLGANPPEDAVYPLNVADSHGRPVTGDHDYVLQFAEDELPPVEAFWSVTMYDAEGFQAANPIDRFAIGDRDQLTYNPDGSLDLYLQHDSPGADKESNWLPAPRGPLGVTMRLYAPKPSVLGGRWTPPRPSGSNQEQIPNASPSGRCGTPRRSSPSDPRATSGPRRLTCVTACHWAAGQCFPSSRCRPDAFHPLHHFLSTNGQASEPSHQSRPPMAARSASDGRMDQPADPGVAHTTGPRSARPRWRRSQSRARRSRLGRRPAG
jgi:hypothetical protein